MATADVMMVADAVVEVLNEGHFSVGFIAERTVSPMAEIKDLVDLKVSVVPRAVEITNATRTTSHYEYGVDVGIQQKLDGTPDDEIPELVALVMEIALSFRGVRLAELGVSCVSVKIDPVYSMEHIQPPSVFTSVVQLKFVGIE